MPAGYPDADDSVARHDNLSTALRMLFVRTPPCRCQSRHRPHTPLARITTCNEKPARHFASEANDDVVPLPTRPPLVPAAPVMTGVLHHLRIWPMGIIHPQPRNMAFARFFTIASDFALRCAAAPPRGFLKRQPAPIEIAQARSRSPWRCISDGRSLPRDRPIFMMPCIVQTGLCAAGKTLFGGEGCIELRGEQTRIRRWTGVTLR